MDPAAITNDVLYTTYGPYAICSKIQEEHGKLISDSDWPALAIKLHESNNTVSTTSDDNQRVQLDQNIQCYKCKQFGHKANNPICSLYNTKHDRAEREPSNAPARNKPKDPWKYVEPKDLFKPVVVDKKKWYFYTKCKCRFTGNVGFYQLSHTDETRNPHWKPEGNSSPIRDPDSTPPPPIRQPATPSSTLDNDLVFTGVNCAPVLRKFRDEREKATVSSEGDNETRHSRKQGRTTYVVRVTDLDVPIDNLTTKCDALVNCVLPIKAHCTEGPIAQPLRTRHYTSYVHRLLGRAQSFHHVIISTLRMLLVSLTLILIGTAQSLQHVVISTLMMLLVSVTSIFALLVSPICAVGNTTDKNVKFWTLIFTLVFWYSFCYHTGTSTQIGRICTTKQICHGYPAKWLIFSHIMFCPTV